MAQVTIYLDDELAKAMKATVRAQNISQSRWISRLIEDALKNEWPSEVAALAGAWQAFPTLEEIRSSVGTDAERESF